MMTPSLNISSFPDFEELRVLVVEPNIEHNELVKCILQEFKVSVSIATSVEQAIRAISLFKPNVLISEIAIPSEDGYSLMSKVKDLEIEYDIQLPAIAMTAYITKDQCAKALNSGFIAYIPKPFRVEELLATVEILGRRLLEIPTSFSN